MIVDACALILSFYISITLIYLNQCTLCNLPLMHNRYRLDVLVWRHALYRYQSHSFFYIQS